VAITVAGILSCYSVNKHGDNRDFIARMICLGWPVGIQVIVGYAAMFLLMMLLFHLFLPPSEVGISEAIGTLLRWHFLPFILLYFAGVTWHLGRVARANAPERGN
jgi:hypothetical protein